MLAQKPDYVVENRCRAGGQRKLPAGAGSRLGFIPISIGAFADADFYAKACAAAKAHGGRIYLPHGRSGRL